MGAVPATMTTGQPVGLEDPTQNGWNAATRLLLSSRKMFKFLIMFENINLNIYVCLLPKLFPDLNVVFCAQSNLKFPTIQQLTITLYKYRNKSMQRSYLTELYDATRSK